MTKLDPELKRKWIDAMKSGEYRFGKELYYNEEECRYCALGVLLKVADKLESSMAVVEGIYSLVDTDTFKEVVALNDASTTINFDPVIAYVEENL